MIGWCHIHEKSMLWRDHPLGWYCRDCMNEMRVVTTNSSKPKSVNW